jgi:hypothetical protein
VRKAMLLLAVFGLLGTLWAADLTVGTWKLNVAESKFAPSAEAPIKELTLVKRDLGTDQFEISETGVRTDGSKISNKFTHPQKGGIVTNSATPKGQMAVATVIGPSELYETVLQNGKQVEVLHVVVSKDGKTMNITVKGTDVKGKPFGELNVFDKQ